jgi:hypothetical protein
MDGDTETFDLVDFSSLSMAKRQRITQPERQIVPIRELWHSGSKEGQEG